MPPVDFEGSVLAFGNHLQARRRKILPIRMMHILPIPLAHFALAHHNPPRFVSQSPALLLFWRALIPVIFAPVISFAHKLNS